MPTWAWAAILFLAAGGSFTIFLFIVSRLKTRRKKAEERQASPTPSGNSSSSRDWGVLPKGAWDYIKPYLNGTFGVCVWVILFGAACLLYAVPGSAGYLWWITPILIAMVFLIVKVSNTVKNEFTRGVIYVVIVIAAGTVILPQLPGSTPAQPIQYTANQLNELDQLHRACPGEKVNFEYLPTHQVVNRSQCFVHFWADKNNEIYVQDAQGNEHGPYCERPGCINATISYEIRAVRSGQGRFIGQIKKDPDYSTLSFYYGRR